MTELSTLSEPVQIYQLDPTTEAAADTWPLVISAHTEEGTEINPLTDKPLIAVRCAEGPAGGQCRQSLGLNAGYVFSLSMLRPRIIEHLTRSHGYPVNAERIK